jgi:hypothetical protein
LKPTQRTQAKPGKRQNPKGETLRKAKRWNECGLHKAEYEGTNGQGKRLAESQSA